MVCAEAERDALEKEPKHDKHENESTLEESMFDEADMHNDTVKGDIGDTEEKAPHNEPETEAPEEEWKPTQWGQSKSRHPYPSANREKKRKAKERKRQQQRKVHFPPEQGEMTEDSEEMDHFHLRNKNCPHLIGLFCM